MIKDLIKLADILDKRGYKAAADMVDGLVKNSDTLVHYTKPALVALIKEYAKEHYAEDGWDYVVESFDDNQIVETIAGETTLPGAIKKMLEHLKPLVDRQKEHDEEARSGGSEDDNPYYQKLLRCKRICGLPDPAHPDWWQCRCGLGDKENAELRLQERRRQLNLIGDGDEGDY